ncbi:MAG: DUF2726 domain-containing protein [Burkholderiales bacterium]|nr:DUF2726 domain-containing protein [Burkholderiales bacterium]MDE2564389.1 DUF2726 domain-containing protein [Burkholderiales bacterium]
MHQLVPSILAAASLALLLAAGVLWLLRRQRPRQRPLPTEWTLTARPVFSSDERRVYRQLREALPHHIVLSKLPLVRFCQPTDPQEVRFWYELLGSANVTFAVCSANGRVLAAIDLDNERGGSRRAMQIKQSVLAACRVRYLRCAPDQLPSIPELQLMVPSSGSAARGPQPAPTATRAREASRSGRRERTTLWQDSGFFQDSFFGMDGRNDLGLSSSFGPPRSGSSPREASPRETPAAPEDVGGVVVDTPAVRMRH